MKIVILDKMTLGEDIGISDIEALGECTVYDNIDDKLIAAALSDADICITNKKVLGKHNLKDCKSLKLICLFATGFNNVDIDFCASRGIKVRNIPGYCTKSVCQHTFALLLALMEQIIYYDDFVKSGKYSESGLANHLGRPFTEISGKRWGIIGMGDIGREVAKVARSFGAEVVFSRVTGAKRREEYDEVTMEELIKTSDIISIHSPLNDNTKNLIDMEKLKMMKKSAFLINTGRGGIVDSGALVHAVDNGYIKGAAVDVYPKEPIDKDDPFMKALNKERFVFSPHIAWGSVEARRRCVALTAENIKSFIKGESLNDVW